MGRVKAQMTGFIGINGRAVHIEEGDEFDADHEVVLGRPDVFGIPGPVRAVETVGEIEEIEPASEDVLNEPLSTENAAPIVRRAHKPKSV